MKKNIIINREAKSIEITKAFYNKACQFGTQEFEELNRAVKEFPEYQLTFRNAKKRTYNGLTIQKMTAYIKTLGDEQMLAKFEAVQKVAEARKALYPLTKQWFLKTFEGITMKEIEAAIKRSAQKDLQKEVKAKLNENTAALAEQDLEKENEVPELRKAC